MNDFRVFSGYVWYAYPKSPEHRFGIAPTHNEKLMLPMVNIYTTAKFGNHHDNSVILVTDNPEKPSVGEFWDVFPCHLPDGAGGEFEGKVVRHVTTTESSPERVSSVFIVMNLV